MAGSLTRIWRWRCSTRCRLARSGGADLIFGPISGAHFNPAVTSSRAEARAHPREALALWQRRLPAARRNDAGACDVRAALLDANSDADRRCAMATRSRRRVQLVRPFSPVSGSTGRPSWCRAHGGLLVHRVDLICQSGGRHRAVADQHFSGIRPVDLPGFIAAGFCGARSAVLIAGCCAEAARARDDKGGPVMRRHDLSQSPAASRNTLAMIRQSGESPRSSVSQNPPGSGTAARTDQGVGISRAMRGTRLRRTRPADPKWSDESW